MNNRGQIVVEYVLLLVIAVGLAALLTRQLVSRSTDDAGIITAKWNAILTAIGNDLPDQRK